jgi:outer membrane receptor protein involved in Fe transport
MSQPRSRWRTDLWLVAAASFATASLAQTAAPPEVVPMPGIEVIGTTPIGGVGVPKEQIPANVQNAKSADIERSHASDLAEFMSRRMGSVHINDVQNNPFQPDVNFRGFTASPLLGTPQGLSVFMDGVRMNQPFGDVVSWDLIPRTAISSIALMPGSNPLFGLNTLGGALSITTKDGLKNPGSSVEARAGSFGRAALEFESGASLDNGLDWYVTGNRFHERGWRDASPTDIGQLFGKLGWSSEATRVTLAAAVADNDLVGNGLQEQRLLARDRAGIYTSPDQTKNRSFMLNLSGTQQLDAATSFSGNAYYRRIDTSTLNGDVNDDSLDQAVYQPDAAEQAALRTAGYSGFPTSGESAANTPFPRWRCIANALRLDEPGKKCNGVNNTTHTLQSNYGLSGQLHWQGDLAGRANLFIAGAAIDASRVHFTQGSELGYINPDRSITGVGAFGDGVSGGNVDGVPYDTRVDLTGRTRTWSVFATDTLAVNPLTHMTLSGRYNHTNVRTSDAIIPGGGPGSLDGDQSFSRFNPAIGLTLAATPAFGIYAGYNEGSRAPSAIELGCADPANPCKLPNSLAGDPPLKQVVTRTIEAGLRGGTKSAFGWNLGVFRADNKDDILFVADNQAGFGYFKNFGRTRRQGVEAGLTLRAGGLNLGANYTYLDVTYRSTEIVDGSANSSNDQAAAGLPGVEGRITINPGDRIPLIPRQILKVFADYDINAAWSLGLDMTAIEGSFARGNENNRHQPDGVYYLGPGRTAGYAVFNLSVDYRPVSSIKIFVQVSNLFDRKYNTASQLGATAFDANGNFQARPFPANAEGDRPLQSSTFFSPGAPRAYLIGVQYAFGK